MPPAAVPTGAAALLHLAVLIPLLSGCDAQYKENWHRLDDGMTKDQVEALLGEPSSRIDAKREGIEIVVPYDRWQYGDNLSTLATAALFPAEAPDRVWVVYFDEHGRVVGYREAINPWR